MPGNELAFRPAQSAYLASLRQYSRQLETNLRKCKVWPDSYHAPDDVASRLPQCALVSRGMPWSIALEPLFGTDHQPGWGLDVEIIRPNNRWSLAVNKYTLPLIAFYNTHTSVMTKLREWEGKPIRFTKPVAQLTVGDFRDDVENFPPIKMPGRSLADYYYGLHDLFTARLNDRPVTSLMGSRYLQIKNRGLFLLGNYDYLELGVPKFDPSFHLHTFAFPDRVLGDGASDSGKLVYGFLASTKLDRTLPRSFIDLEKPETILRYLLPIRDLPLKRR